MMKTTLPLAVTQQSTRAFLRKAPAVLSHRTLWAVIASGAVSGCLVEPPECKRCSSNETTSDGGVVEGPDAAVVDTSSLSNGEGGTISHDTFTPSTTVDGTPTGTTDNNSEGETPHPPGNTGVDSTTGVDSAVNSAGGDGSSASIDTEASDTGTSDDEGNVSLDTSAPDTTGPGGVSTSEPGTHEDTSASGSTSGGESTEPPAPVHEVKWHESFEQGWGQWTVEGDTWAVGTPSNGAAPTARDGAQVVGTGLAGPYVRENARLLSPQFIVPGAGEQSYLRYWYWYSLEAGDTVQVQVRVGEEVNWVDLHVVTDTISTVAGHGDRWMQALLPLDEFANQEIQLSFAVTAAGENCSLPGFFIDNVSLETGPMNICSCQGFNDGNVGDWSIEGGQWGIGAAGNVDAPSPADASNGLAGTNLSGPYESLAAAPVARLSSPTFKVANAYQKARFFYWYSFASAGRGKIQARTLGQPWEDLAGYEFSNSSGEEFTYLELDLEPWVGEVVQFGFLVENGGGVDTPVTPGFYIDEFFYRE